MMDEGNKRKFSKIVKEINLFISNFFTIFLSFLISFERSKYNQKKIKEIMALKCNMNIITHDHEEIKGVILHMRVHVFDVLVELTI